MSVTAKVQRRRSAGPAGASVRKPPKTGVVLCCPTLCNPRPCARITAENESCQRMWREPSYDTSEQKIGHHCYTLRVFSARRIAAPACEAPRRP